MSDDNVCTNCDTPALACERTMSDCCCECRHEDD